MIPLTGRKISGRDGSAAWGSRGGGSTSDLGCFDNYRLCAYIAQFPLPVITGIGHDKDVSVADMVAHTSLKTPTAVAAFLVGRAAEMAGQLNDLRDRVTRRAKQLLVAETHRIENAGLQLASRSSGVLHGGLARLEKLKNGLRFGVGERLTQERHRCASFGSQVGRLVTQRLAAAEMRNEYVAQRLGAMVKGVISRRRSQLELLEVSVRAASPQRILARGYAIVRGVRGVAEAEVGQAIEIELRDGVLGADVTSKSIQRKNG